MKCTEQTFDQWLQANDLDAKEWTPELRASLRARFEQETAPQVEPAESSTVAIIAPVDCKWPARVYRVEVTSC